MDMTSQVTTSIGITPSISGKAHDRGDMAAQVDRMFGSTGDAAAYCAGMVKAIADTPAARGLQVAISTEDPRRVVFSHVPRAFGSAGLMDMTSQVTTSLGITPSISGKAHDRMIERWEGNIVNVVLIQDSDGKFYFFSINTASSETESFIVSFLITANPTRPSSLDKRARGNEHNIYVTSRSPGGSHQTFQIRKISKTYDTVHALEEAIRSNSVSWRSFNLESNIWGPPANANDQNTEYLSTQPVDKKPEESKQFAMAGFRPIDGKGTEEEIKAFTTVTSPSGKLALNPGKKLGKNRNLPENLTRRNWIVNQKGNISASSGYSLTSLSEFVNSLVSLEQKRDDGTLIQQWHNGKGWLMPGATEEVEEVAKKDRFAMLVIGNDEMKNVRLAQVANIKASQFALSLSVNNEFNNGTKSPRMPAHLWRLPSQRAHHMKVAHNKGRGSSDEFPIALLSEFMESEEELKIAYENNTLLAQRMVGNKWGIPMGEPLFFTKEHERLVRQDGHQGSNLRGSVDTTTKASGKSGDSTTSSKKKQAGDDFMSLLLSQCELCFRPISGVVQTTRPNTCDWCRRNRNLNLL